MVPSTWQLPITTVIHFDSHNNHHSHQEQHQHQQQHFLHQHHHSDRRAFCVGIEPVRVCRCWCVVPWFSGLVPLGHRSGSSHGPPVGKDRGTNPEPPDPWASHPRERRAPKAPRTSGISRASIPRFPRAENRGRKMESQPRNRDADLEDDPALTLRAGTEHGFGVRKFGVVVSGFEAVVFLPHVARRL